MLLRLLRLGALGLDILDSCLDGIFSQHAAVQLHWGQAEVLGNVAILDC